ncbi:hypothetical protein DUNSADRAFT_13274 [Dunaliella salina]|uniref:60S acidic ribosomal protein P2 n=1 Tax=Dunaliella salina TaxID=3046 RepID=A0ABQ7G9Q8_DUNSA|nr:hypothetical protein DUNSADRAFT_13274 [Dunaliella salina]|eukprot:KAF5831335.1 hypothetical protein DUNSADRAFT_13274 [Dunaliella salina]
MKHVAALLLAQLGGNANPGEADVKAILGSVGVEANADELSKLMSEVQGKDVAQLVEEGKKKLASLPAAGAAPAAAAPAAGGGGGAAPAAKKEEKKEESEEEDMGFSLFD